MKSKFILILIILSFVLLSGCMDARSFCEPGMIKHRDRSEPFPELSNQTLNPQQVEIRGKPLDFDHVVSGQLCNNELKGKVYIGCDIEIYSWDTKSTFLDDCDFNVASGSIIYVAAHNNTPYYKGCDSCHMTRE